MREAPTLRQMEEQRMNEAVAARWSVGSKGGRCTTAWHEAEGVGACRGQSTQEPRPLVMGSTEAAPTAACQGGELAGRRQTGGQRENSMGEGTHARRGRLCLALGWDCGNSRGTSRARGGGSGVFERSESGLARSTPPVEWLPPLHYEQRRWTWRGAREVGDGVARHTSQRCLPRAARHVAGGRAHRGTETGSVHSERASVSSENLERDFSSSMCHMAADWSCLLLMARPQPRRSCHSGEPLRQRRGEAGHEGTQWVGPDPDLSHLTASAADGLSRILDRAAGFDRHMDASWPCGRTAH